MLTANNATPNFVKTVKNVIGAVTRDLYLYRDSFHSCELTCLWLDVVVVEAVAAFSSYAMDTMHTFYTNRVFHLRNLILVFHICFVSGTFATEYTARYQKSRFFYSMGPFSSAVKDKT